MLSTPYLYSLKATYICVFTGMINTCNSLVCLKDLSQPQESSPRFLSLFLLIPVAKVSVADSSCVHGDEGPYEHMMIYAAQLLDNVGFTINLSKSVLPPLEQKSLNIWDLFSTQLTWQCNWHEKRHCIAGLAKALSNSANPTIQQLAQSYLSPMSPTEFLRDDALAAVYTWVHSLGWVGHVFDSAEVFSLSSTN